MKQHIVRLLHAGCLCLAVLLPSAFAQNQAINVDLPFAFQVNNKQFPAGKYRVSAGPGQSALLLRSDDRKQAMYSLTLSVESGKVREQPTMVFHRYGDRYFLSQIWMGGSNTGRGLATGAAERETARRLAQAGPQPATELVAILGERGGRNQ